MRSPRNVDEAVTHSRSRSPGRCYKQPWPREITSCAAFRALHASGCFVIPNPWDVGTAIALHQLGFKALASTSAGLAFTHGLADSTPLEDVLSHLRAIVAATPLPVSAGSDSGVRR